MILANPKLKKTHLRKDLSILQEAKYGLFNVDQWKREVSDVLAAKLESFDLNETNREELQKEIELLLRTIVEDAEQHYYKDHSTSILGVLQNATSNILGVFDHLKKEIPSATTIIIDFLDDPNNREEVRQYLMNELDEYSSETFGKTNYDAVDEVFQRHGIEPLERRIRMTKGRNRYRSEITRDFEKSRTHQHRFHRRISTHSRCPPAVVQKPCSHQAGHCLYLHLVPVRVKHAHFAHSSQN